jgi:hypothetical protein
MLKLKIGRSICDYYVDIGNVGALSSFPEVSLCLDGRLFHVRFKEAFISGVCFNFKIDFDKEVLILDSYEVGDVALSFHEILTLDTDFFVLSIVNNFCVVSD